MKMNYLQNSFLKIGVLSLTLLVLGCSNQANDVEAKKVGSVVEQDDSKYDAEFKEVGKVFQAGVITQDKDKVKEALKLISELIEKKPDSIKFLDQRSNIYMVLDEPKQALADLEARNSIQKTGVSKFAECATKDMVAQNTDSEACYEDAASLFAKEIPEPEKDANYLTARLFSGDKTAEQKIQKLAESTEDDMMKRTYEMVLKSHQKYVECKKLAKGPCPLS